MPFRHKFLRRICILAEHDVAHSFAAGRCVSGGWQRSLRRNGSTPFSTCSFKFLSTQHQPLEEVGSFDQREREVDQDVANYGASDQQQAIPIRKVPYSSDLQNTHGALLKRLETSQASSMKLLRTEIRARYPSMVRKAGRVHESVASVPERSSWMQSTTMLGSCPPLDKPKEILTAQLSSDSLRRPFLTHQDWAGSLYSVAMNLYQSLEPDLGKSATAPTMMNDYNRMLDLLQVWNVFFQVHQTGVKNPRIPLLAFIRHQANESPSSKDYGRRVLAFVPEWRTEPESTAHRLVVYASWLTITAMVSIRHKILSAFDDISGINAIPAAKGSLLNLKDANSSESIFIHIIGRAFQGVSLNKINTRLDLAELGLSANASDDMMQVMTQLHTNPDILIDEAERYSQRLLQETLDASSTSLKLDTNPAYSGFARDILMPILLRWLKMADLQQLGHYRLQLQQVAQTSVVDSVRGAYQGILARYIHLGETPGSSTLLDQQILQTLQEWEQHSTFVMDAQTQNLVRKRLLARAENIEWCMAVWDVSQRGNFYLDRLSWLRDLIDWLFKDARPSNFRIEYFTKIFEEVMKARRSDTVYQRRELLLKLTNYCMEQCISTALDWDTASALPQVLERANIKPDRQSYRLLIRLGISSGQNWKAALGDYYKLPYIRESFETESRLFYTSQMNKFGASYSHGPLETLLFDVSGAVKIYYRKHPQPLPKFYFTEAGKIKDIEQWSNFIQAHETLLNMIMEQEPKEQPLRYRLRAAGSIHMHLLRSLSEAELPPPLVERVEAIEDQIMLLFDKSQSEDQLKFMSRQIFTTHPSTVQDVFPVVMRRGITRHWLCETLQARFQGYDATTDVGSDSFPTIREHLERLQKVLLSRAVDKQGYHIRTAVYELLTTVRAIERGREAGEILRVRLDRKQVPRVVSNPKLKRRETLFRGTRSRATSAGYRKNSR